MYGRQGGVMIWILIVIAALVILVAWRIIQTVP
jgi:hypothetical protein